MIYTGRIITAPNSEGFGFIRPNDLAVRNALPANKDLHFHVNNGVFPEGKTFRDLTLKFGAEVSFQLTRRGNAITASPWTLKNHADLLPDITGGK